MQADPRHLPPPGPSRFGSSDRPHLHPQLQTTGNGNGQRSEDGASYRILNNEVIGTGAFGIVTRGRVLSSGAPVAVKRCFKENEIRAAKQEVDILKKCQGAANIVQYIGSREHPPTHEHPFMFSFAMELAMCSLEDLLRQPNNRRGLAYDIIIDLITDCSSAMITLNERNIAHRDIKQLNILVFHGPKTSRRSQFLFKFCDFGGAKDTGAAQAPMKTLVGSPGYLHPYLAENLRMGPPRSWTIKNGYTALQIDLWSLGCTLYYSACGDAPFPSQNGEVYYQAVAKLQQLPEAIACHCKGRQEDRNTRNYEYLYEFFYEVPNHRYPKWFIFAFSRLLRSLFHNPSIETLAKYADILQKAKVHKFIAVNNFEVYEYADLKNEKIFGDPYPSLQTCLTIEPATKYVLMSESEMLDASYADVSKLRDEPYLILPILSNQPLEIATLKWRHQVHVKFDSSMPTQKLVSARRALISDAFEALEDGNRLLYIVENAQKILQRRLEMAQSDLLVSTSMIALPNRFATYAESQSIALILASESAGKIVEECRLKAIDSQNELSRHTDTLNGILAEVKLLLAKVSSIKLMDIDTPGIKELLADCSTSALRSGAEEGDMRDFLIETHQFALQQANKCLGRRADLMRQMLNERASGLGTDKTTSMVQDIYHFMSSILIIYQTFDNCQRNIAECAEILERPFQEMKSIVSQFAVQNGVDAAEIGKKIKIIANYKGIFEDMMRNFELAQHLSAQVEHLQMSRLSSRNSTMRQSMMRSSTAPITSTNSTTSSNQFAIQPLPQANEQEILMKSEQL